MTLGKEQSLSRLLKKEMFYFGYVLFLGNNKSPKLRSLSGLIPGNNYNIKIVKLLLRLVMSGANYELGSPVWGSMKIKKDSQTDAL